MSNNTIDNIEFIVACGGIGSRNYPHSKGLPHKSLMPFGDVRLIDFILNQIVSVGGKHITLVCSNQEVIDAFKKALATDEAMEKKFRGKGLDGIANALKRTFLPDNIDLKYVIQDKPLGTGHVLALAHQASPDRHGVLIFPDDIIVAKDPKQSHLRRMTDQFSKDEHQILCFGMKKTDVSNNAILHEGRLIEKPKNPSNLVGIYSPILMPKETLDFMLAKLNDIEKNTDMAKKEYYYVDGINEFLDKQGARTPFYIDIVMKNENDTLLDTGTLPFYEKAQLFALLNISEFKEDNRKYIDILLDSANPNKDIFAGNN